MAFIIGVIGVFILYFFVELGSRIDSQKKLDKINRNIEKSKQQFEARKIELEQKKLPNTSAPKTPSKSAIDTVQDEQFKYKVFLENEKKYASVALYIGFASPSSITSVVIPDDIDGVPIEEIGAEVFSMFDNMKNIKLPKSIKSIGKAAFQNNRELCSISLGTSIKHIDAQAFQGCSKMKFNSFPPVNAEYIGDGAVDSVNIDTLRIDTKTKYGSHVFSNCRIHYLVLDTSRDIDRAMFYNEVIDYVRIIDGVTVIRTGLFENAHIKNIYIPESVTFIDYKGASISSYEYSVLKLDGTPDYRYNPKKVYKDLKSVVYCAPGSYGQEYARKQGFEVKPLSEFYPS